MKRFLSVLLAAMLLLACASAENILPVVDYHASQAEIDAFLAAEGEAGYSFESPLVVLNPYGSAPLSALAIFTTEEEIGGTVTSKGKASEDDISGSFAAAKVHYVPIFGLYAGGVTEVVITLDDGRSTSVQVETEPLNLTCSEFSVTMNQPENYDFSKLNIAQLIRERGYVGFDSKGDARWALLGTGFQGQILLENGRMIIPTTFRYSSMNWWANGLREVDGLGKVYNEYIYPGGTHHDFMLLPNGNYLAVADTPNDIDSEDYLAEIDPSTGEMVWNLDLDELLRRDDGGAYAWDEHDWAHINAVDYDESKDLLIISARHQDAIIGIHKTEKELAWILGDPSGWQEESSRELLLTPVGEGFEWQYGAHECSFLSDGSILLFDNGLGGRAKMPDQANALPAAENYSRAVIYKVDEENMTVEQVWQYGKELGTKYFSDSRSGVECSSEADEAYFINFGICNTNWDGSKDSNAICTYLQCIEKDELVWELAYVGMTYRAFRGAPYAFGGNFDIDAKPVWFGGMGDTPEIDSISIDPESAQPLDAQLSANAYPFSAIRISGSYITEDAGNLGTHAVILMDEIGSQHAFDLTYYTSNAQDGTLITLDAWISTTGLEPGSYEAYLRIGDAVYSAGTVISAGA